MIAQFRKGLLQSEQNRVLEQSCPLLHQRSMENCERGGDMELLFFYVAIVYSVYLSLFLQIIHLMDSYKCHIQDFTSLILNFKSDV